MSRTPLKGGDKPTVPGNWLGAGRRSKEAAEGSNRGLTAVP